MPTLDTGHAQASGLVCVYRPGDQLNDYVSAARPLTLGGGVANVTDATWGASIDQTAASSNAIVTPLPAAYQTAYPVTLMWFGRLKSTTGSSHTFGTRLYVSPYTNYKIARASGWFRGYFYDGSVERNIDGGFSPVNDQVQTVVLVLASGDQRLYINDLTTPKVTGSYTLGSISGSTNGELVIGGNDGADAGVYSAEARLYNRAWTTGEVAALSRDAIWTTGGGSTFVPQVIMVL